MSQQPINQAGHKLVMPAISDVPVDHDGLGRDCKIEGPLLLYLCCNLNSRSNATKKIS